MKKKMAKMRKILFFVFLLMVNAIFVFASPSDNIMVVIRDNGSFVEVINNNDTPVTVSLSIEYKEGDVIRFAPVTLSLGRKGFSSSFGQWGQGIRGIQIIDVRITSVR